MSRRRVFTDEQCRALARWHLALRAAGSVRGKARELGVSKGALMDAIARGNGSDPRAMREKLSQADIDALVGGLESCST